MISSVYMLLFAGVFAFAAPALEVRTVTSLNQAAFQDAQQRDDTATRAFSGTQVKTGTGQCLFVNELSGDFRANLNPIQVAACDGSQGQKWDIITKGKHDDQAGTMLLVNTLTQACMNFDPRRAAGNRVIMFSCGGRADGGGDVTNSQLFSFSGGAGPFALQPINSQGSCLGVVAGNVLDLVSCKAGDSSQSFSFASGASKAAASSSSNLAITTSVAAEGQAVSSAQQFDCTSTAFVTLTRSAAAKTTAGQSASSKGSALPVAQADINPTSPVPVSRAGGKLNPTAAAEANKRDNTATRAFSGVSLKSADGQCLFIDPTAGDFRQNLIPVQLQPCTGSANEKFDFITAGAHNNAANSTLIVSSLMQGCLNFDSRRAAGDTVMMFSCGGRGDGAGQTTNSQLFPFAAGEKSVALAPENSKGAVCLAPKNGKLDQAACNGSASQKFTIS